MIGPGKYDDVTTLVREQTQAQGVIVIVISGQHGSGFSVQAPLGVQIALPTLLRSLAAQIESDWTTYSTLEGARSD